ncbi:putative DNA binding domain-containing protein [Desulfosarcina sp. OttesenSCG-928-A07]|nr:putative DNA binding domain-containing protein [Desulfosarcina sp. OttesenSCG-928-G17]MDL2330125.1 putative DNA binding domain-containing protein [Desulfosarcina sp. OttesenSCG-928-A07]
MLKTELLEIISNGENSGVEFKRDNIRPEQLAKEVVAFANVQGGRILLGVEDDGRIIGLQHANTQEWVLNVFRDKVHPLIIPFYEEIGCEDKKRVGVITISPGISKPYVMRHNNREEIYVRMGDRSELATREQQARLFQAGGLLHVEVLPVAGTTIKSLDLTRLDFYLREIIKDPEVPTSEEEWIDRLLGLGLMAEDGFGNTVCSIAGLLCFGIAPRRFFKQAGLRIMVFNSINKEYRALLDTILDEPLVGRWTIGERGQKLLAGEGLIEKFSSLILPFVTEEAAEIDENMRREKKWLYPWEAIREAVINALAHRDWTRSVDIEVTVYADRMEIISPGSLQNSMTIRKMIAGQRSPRNTLIVEILRDHGYVDSRGMGVRTKIIPLMRQYNQTDPIFEATEDYVKTILPKGKTESRLSSGRYFGSIR